MIARTDERYADDYEAASKAFLTEAEYLAVERASDKKSEYFDGEMSAMSAASFRHNLIVVAIAAYLRTVLRKGCRVVMNDLRVMCDAPGFWMIIETLW